MRILNALTVDVEDWYHVCGLEGTRPSARTAEARVQFGIEEILDLLAEFQTRATFFVLGSIARDAPNLVRDIAARGHEIGSHGDDHRKLDDLDRDSFAADLGASLEAISSACGARVLGYRAPQWSLRRDTWWAFPVLARAGLCYDASTVPLTGMGDRSLPPWPYSVATPHGPVQELPLTTMRCFWERLPVSGGLPLRVTPYWFVVEVLRAANRRRHPHVVYAHPWEFDPAHPRISMPVGKRFAHYFRLPATSQRIRMLLGRFRYGPAAEVLGVYR